MSNLVLAAPLEGWIAPLDEAPDPVFAERMLGDGVLIDPIGAVLHAPASGEIVSVHQARHAIAMRCDNGAELLMHVGVDTVALGGQGFEAHVGAGARVAAGEKLLSFDLDLLARRAKSLVTPIIVTNGAAILSRAQNKPAALGDFLMELEAVAEPPRAGAAASQSQARARVTVPLAHGLHARPAARIAEAAKAFNAEIALHAQNRSANAKSPVAILALAVRLGDEIEIAASGEEAQTAVDALAGLIAAGMGEAVVRLGPAEAEARPAPTPMLGPRTLRGVAAAPGMAIGVAVRLFDERLAAPVAAQGPRVERAALAEAVSKVRTRIAASAEAGPQAARAIMRAHLAFIDDPELAAAAGRNIDAGQSAGVAWRAAIAGFADALKALGDKRLAERVDDLIDLERQVLRVLAGEEEAQSALPAGAILVAEEILPSQLLRLDHTRLAGIATARGGPTSHVAILASALGVPALVALGPEALAIPNGAAAILDADAGQISILPDAAALERAQGAIAARHERRAAALAHAHDECRMADGTRIEVFANLASCADARAARENGAEGCGLLRTEFLFLDRAAPPGEDEQYETYQAIAGELEGRPLIIRTLDIGADKPASYLPIPAEDNPALGLRGVRVSLWRPHLLKTQLRAILRVRPPGQCKIMIPMIADVSELRAVRTLLDECRGELGVTEPVPLGIMIETPAAAAAADILAAEADFFSIGTNDLTQYALAMDRTNVELAARIDALHPALLRLMAQSVAGARAHGRWVGVCGGLAADLLAAPILIGLGVTELSATPALAPELKALVRKLTRTSCEELATAALRETSADGARALARRFAERLP